MDQAFLKRGVLQENMQGLASDMEAAQTPDLSNRKIYAVEFQPGSRIALAGAEGALYRTADDGKTWTAAIEEQGSSLYPFIGHIAFSSRTAGLALVGGFNKASDPLRAFLAVVLPNGKQWFDISSSLGNLDNVNVADLKEDPSGRLLALAVDAPTRTLTVYEAKIH